MKKAKKWNELSSGIVLSISMAYMLCIYEPLMLYFNNKYDTAFWYDFYTLIPILLFVFAVMAVISAGLSGVLRIVSVRIYRIWILIYSVVFFATYVQGNYLAGNLPVLDGSDVIWGLYDWQRKYCIILWVVSIVIAISVCVIKDIRTENLYFGVILIDQFF